MEKETDQAIDQGYRRGPTEHRARSPRIKKTPDASPGHGSAQDDRSPHHFLSVTSFVVFVGNFQAGQNTRGASHEGKSALEPALSNMRVRLYRFLPKGRRKISLKKRVPVAAQVTGGNDGSSPFPGHTADTSKDLL
jgi:hypothetical protein